MALQVSRFLSRFSRDEVRQVFRKAKIKKKIEGLEFFLAPRLFEFGRILVITPRKTGNAPERNKIRRRLKAIFYEEKLYEQPYDCIIIVRKEAIQLSFDQLKKILTDLIIYPACSPSS